MFGPFVEPCSSVGVLGFTSPAALFGVASFGDRRVMLERLPSILLLPLFAVGAAVGVATSDNLSAQTLFVEAEAFSNPGGWAIDTANTLIVGSPYLLAHGLGRPVEDATTRLSVSAAGAYRFWVRTKDWVAPWGARGTPGRFRLLIDGKPAGPEFGTKGADWHWHDGGTVRLAKGDVTLALRDLTGFDGRCDAIVFSRDADWTPPTGSALTTARRRWLGAENDPQEHRGYDLVVVGGGYAGLAAAISAARQSLRVALIQDRFVLGGNGSSEVRVWANGGTMRGAFPRLGEIVEEFADHAPDSPGIGEHYGDRLKEDICRREKNIDLFLGHFARGVDVDPKTKHIRSVTALDVRRGRERRFHGRFFADCTGHGTIGALAGADYHIEPKARLGMSNMWCWQNIDVPSPWPTTPWALPLEPGDFPPTVASRSRLGGRRFYKGEWFWESGFEKDPIEDLELIRDWNLRAVFGAFSALKRDEKNSKARLLWVAHVGGTRESRLLRGDIVLTAADIVKKRAFPDGCVPTTWDIDLHYPKERYAKKFPDNPFISRAEFGAGVDRNAGYPIPYRCFYSRDVSNLFMAGRCISVTHEALGTVRVMRTCGMMGEVVGRAAYLCVRHDVLPRGVYEKHLDALIALQHQPGAMRRDVIDGELRRDSSIGAVRSYRTKGQDHVDGLSPRGGSVAVSALPGIVVDDDQAELTGTWSTGGLSPFVGKGYRYANSMSKATARFRFSVRDAGTYDLRIAWVGHDNRARNVRCVVERPGRRPLTLRLDQTKSVDSESKGASHGLFHDLGEFPFPVGEGAVVLHADDAKGHVHADAVQLLKVK